MINSSVSSTLSGAIVDTVQVGWSLILLGILLTFVGFIVMILGSASKVEWGGGAVIFIGPIPIVIGGGRLGWIAILIAVLLAFMMIIMMFAFPWKAPRPSSP